MNRGPRSRMTPARAVRAGASALLGLAILWPGPASAQEAALPLVSEYPVLRPVEPPPAYANAVSNGTRRESGEPGPGYWQQKVDYEIEARLDPATGILEGSETVRYTNNAPGELAGLVVRLYQNVFAPGAPRNRSVRLTGGMRIDRVAVGARELSPLTPADFEAAGAGESPVGFTVEGTVANLFLPEPIPSGGTIELSFEWAFRVPDATAFRTGHLDNEVFAVAQWYPQIAVVDDVFGFDRTPYLGDGEFYLEYGDFEVAITVPEGWLVAATGELTNAAELLPAPALERLDAAIAQDTAVRIVDPGGLAPVATGGAVRTWRFSAEQVRDFAFATSRRYAWDAVGAAVGGTRSRITVHAVYDAELEHWREAAAYAKRAIELFSRYLAPYPYSHVTAAYGPVGGMEYPMIVFIGESSPGEPLYGVLAHEIAHQWFPIVVGSPEAAYAWMDEGLATFGGLIARARYFENQVARLQTSRQYLLAAQLGVEVPLMRHTDHVAHVESRTVAAYDKPATLLFALRRMLGGEAFDRALRDYADAWSYKHPYPWDFFSIFEGVAERDLDWFWRAWFYDTVTLDQSLEEVVPGPGSVSITVANLDGGVMPVELGLEFEDGTTERIDWPVDVWAGTRRVTREVPIAKSVVRVVLDPERYYPDLDRSNNVWPEDTLNP